MGRNNRAAIETKDSNLTYKDSGIQIPNNTQSSKGMKMHVLANLGRHRRSKSQMVEAPQQHQPILAQNVVVTPRELYGDKVDSSSLIAEGQQTQPRNL